MNRDHPPLPLNAGTSAGVWAVALGRDGGYEFSDAGAGMLVFWWQGRPVGHRFVEHDTPRPLHGHVDAELLARIDAEERAAAAPREPASVVICTRDRPKALARCLASLREQTLAPREVIVVDNASRDARTSEIAAAAGAVVVREERPGLDFARNAGARRATMPIVAYTDDDVQLNRAWLERMVAAFDRDDIAAVTGLVLPGELATEAQHHFETHWSFGRGYLRRDHDAQQFQARRDEVFPAWEIGAGASMAFRREVFERIGGFDERLDVAPRRLLRRLGVLVPPARARAHVPLRAARGGVPFSPPQRGRARAPDPRLHARPRCRAAGAARAHRHRSQPATGVGAHATLVRTPRLEPLAWRAAA
jgi:hypothetical protein